MAKLRKLDKHGDSVLEWTPGLDDAKAKEEFDRLVSEGHLAYRIDKPGKGTSLRDFDPRAEEVVFTRPLVGG